MQFLWAISLLYCFLFLTEEIDECLLNWCENKAKCVNTEDSFKCLCARGWAGETCQSNIYYIASSIRKSMVIRGSFSTRERGGGGGGGLL